MSPILIGIIGIIILFILMASGMNVGIAMAVSAFLGLIEGGDLSRVSVPVQQVFSKPVYLLNDGNLEVQTWFSFWFSNGITNPPRDSRQVKGLF